MSHDATPERLHRGGEVRRVAAVRGDGVMVLPIRYLVELKLASGLTNPDRLKDLADVQELIRHAALPLELVDELAPMVREKYAEIWNSTKRDEDSDY
jgi:hypothetical protein